MSRARLENPGGTVSPEDVQDIVGAEFVDSTSIDFVYDDTANTMTGVVPGVSNDGTDLTIKPIISTGHIVADLSVANSQMVEFFQVPTLTAAQLLIRFGQAGTLGASGRLRGIVLDSPITFSGAVNANPIQLFTYAPLITLDPAVSTTNINAITGYIANPVVALGASLLNYGNVQTAGAPALGYKDIPSYTAATAGALATMNAGHEGYQQKIGEIGLGWTFAYLAGMHVYAVQAGLGTITQQVALDVEDLATYPGTHTNIPLSVRSIGATVQGRHAGPFVFGANAAPANASVGVEVQSVTRALLISRMTGAQAAALTALDGMVVYVTDNAGAAPFNTGPGWFFRDAGAWVKK